MKTTNTFGVVFYLRKYKATDGKAPIYARITVDGKRSDIALKRAIEEQNWNGAKGLARGKSEEIRALNTFLEQVRYRITECYQEILLKKRLVTADAVKNKYCGFEEKEHSLISIFDYHNTEMKTSLEWGTLKNYFTTKRYLEEFLKAQLKTSDIYLSLLDNKFLADFERFMKAYTPQDQKKPCGQNTIMKHIERLRKVVNMAIKNDWFRARPIPKIQTIIY